MCGKWVGPLGLFALLLVVGCRSTQPDLKPPPQPEVFNAPPANARYDSYPKQAFNVDDPLKRAGSPANSNPIMPTRGMSPGMGAMPGR